MADFGDGYVGTAADGLRIRRLEKQRQEQQQKMEELKKKSAQGLQGLLQFGTATSEKLETAFKEQTVGLVTREQFVEKRSTLQSKIEEEERSKKQRQKEDEEELLVEKRLRRRAKQAPTARLSFAEDEDEEGSGSESDNESDKDEEGSGGGDKEKGSTKKLVTNGDYGEVNKKRKLTKLGKDPTVETSFLPDREREAQELEERERLKKEWIKEQERMKNEPLEITYSYWDGTGHRRIIKVRKGDTIADFLRAVQQQLAAEFREVRTSSVENLLYIKEDLIIPHQYSFYELIINKARGKSGPLFHFDVHEDIRTSADARIEKDESHAGKIVERHWYEKNKHIFPASRWEIYDPTKKWDRYTVHGD